jgi:hypothetical protein
MDILTVLPTNENQRPHSRHAFWPLPLEPLGAFPARPLRPRRSGIEGPRHRSSPAGRQRGRALREKGGCKIIGLHG